MKELERIVGKFPEQTLGVIGDAMLDHYISGDTLRISPEAPTPIVLGGKEHFIPGGAANAAANIAALAKKVSLVGIIGKDEAGKNLKKALLKSKVNIDGLIEYKPRPTIQKIRVVTRGQQVLRIDKEYEDYINSSLEKRIIKFISSHIKDWNAVVISDYAKGFVTYDLAKEIIALANKYNKPVIVDTKPRNFSFYKKVAIITPNVKEAEDTIGQRIASEKELKTAGKILRGKSNSPILITEGRNGMTLFQASKTTHLKSVAREVFDVTGAGDTVLAVIALSIACKGNIINSAKLGNHAGGVAVSKVGTATISLKELKSSFSKNDKKI